VNHDILSCARPHGFSGRPLEWDCAMSELIKAAKLFSNSGHQRITIQRNPALQSPEAHLKSVAQIVSSVSEDDEMIAAAWLHDIVEDTEVTIDDLERQFGVRVAKLVHELTVVCHPARRHSAASFALTKQHFAKVSDAAKTVKLADLIDTCRDLYKNDWALFSTYVAEANELALVLNGGNSRLLARLKRDLNKYASSIQPARPSEQVLQSRRFEIPIATLRVLEGAFTAQDIAQPLITFDSNRTETEILEAMTVAGVEVSGLQRDGTLWGFVGIASLSKGAGQTWGREFAAGQLVYATSTFMDVIEILTRHDWCFVMERGNVIGAISRIDMHKPVGRMWLFGILTLAELEFTERIRRKWPGESWNRLLSPQRMDKARQLLAERERRKEKCHLIDCLQLADKIEILIADPSELAAIGIPSQSLARRVGKQIESLRNSLAHAQSFVEQDWPQIVRLTRRIHKMSEEL
jgi:hypothetical protein